MYHSVLPWYVSLILPHYLKSIEEDRVPGTTSLSIHAPLLLYGTMDSGLVQSQILGASGKKLESLYAVPLEEATVPQLIFVPPPVKFLLCTKNCWERKSTEQKSCPLLLQPHYKFMTNPLVKAI